MRSRIFFRRPQRSLLLRQLPFYADEDSVNCYLYKTRRCPVTHNQDEDILLKLSMAGKSLRMKPSEAPALPEEQTPVQQTLQSQPQPSVPAAPQPAVVPTPLPVQPGSQPTYQPQRDTSTVVPPANTPPQSEEAQEDILRKLTMKPKPYEVVAPEMLRETSPEPKKFGVFTQTPEEARSNKPYVSSDSEVDRVRKLAQNIYGSDAIQK